jgi:glycosyltransferase involved in cell wall biosynthesis
MRMEDAYATDPAYLRRLGVEVRPAVPFGRVIGWMSRATFNPVLLRPTFGRLGLVTPRLFETPAAGTIPLLGPGAAHVPELYGEGAGELVLPDEEPQEKILDLVSRPERYAAIVAGIRRHLAERHSHAARLRQLIEIVES